jgi:hypothetical protein
MNKHSLINSFLLSVCLGVTGWVAHKAAESGERIASVQTGFAAMKEGSDKAERASAEGLQRLERKLDEMVPRREFDARVLLIEAEQRKSDIHLREIDLEILKLQQGLR